MVLLITAGCRGRVAYVEDVPEDKCSGGRIDQERKTTDVVLGRTRNTVLRTQTCLER
jgi:hypothetical protein